MTAEAGALGLAAVLLGTVCGALQGLVMVDSVIRPGVDWDLAYVFSASAALRIGGFVLLVAVIAGVMPAYRAARVEITRAIGYE